MRIHETGRGFVRLLERIHEDLWGFVRIHETLGEDSQDFGRGSVKICEGKDLQGICEDL